MTLFGTTLDGQQIAGLVGLLAVLAFWLFAYRGERSAIQNFRAWEAARKSRKDAEDGVKPEGTSGPGTGPWG
nr:hypothetical protein [Brevundimonas variabilis]